MSRTTSVHEIQVIGAKGAWSSKSGGVLEVSLALPRTALEKFLDFDNPDFDEVPSDIRGLRTYIVRDIPMGSVGAKEWHKIRTEYMTALAGRARVKCVDFSGEARDFILDGKSSIIIPRRYYIPTLHWRIERGYR